MPLFINVIILFENILTYIPLPFFQTLHGMLNLFLHVFGDIRNRPILTALDNTTFDVRNLGISFYHLWEN